MQPTYLPWVGYFDLIDQADVFIFLDNVQFARRSWQHRNRIRTSKGLEWLTVPVTDASRDALMVGAAEIAAGHRFPRRHLRALEHNYRRAPHFDAYFPPLERMLTDSGPMLSVLNIRLVRWLADAIGVSARFEVSSELGASGPRSALLIDICEKTGADRYLSPLGALSYLAEDSGDPGWRGREIAFQRYEHPPYRQVFSPFMPYASALDLLFNEGPHSLDILRAGRRPSLSLPEAMARAAAPMDTATGGVS